MNDSVDSIKLSLIIPVYNRPDEVNELLESLVLQTNKNFEVVIVEDGSAITSESIVKSYVEKLSISYYFKTNSGPGQSRNYGSDKASGNYLVFLDSDCILPEHYVETVLDALTTQYVDAYGGPDRAHESFSVFQKAINYSMTSFFTTGGIRGGGEKADKFFPRSFNMGYSKQVYEVTQGFGKMRFGEDIDMSIRIIKNNFTTKLLKEAYVYHKRRSTSKSFFKQVFNSGMARINLQKKHPNSLKIVHTFPTLFVFGVLTLLLLSVGVSSYFLAFLIFHMLLLFVDSTVKNSNIVIGAVSVYTSYLQLFSYGVGFIYGVYKVMLLNKENSSAFTKNFYK
ncbi:MAG: glycosyltransferase [Flavobacteriales bacterium]|jgi:glycosyltransferase involved in cell wall biosynthesis|nr:glycosyltransferase [Flavobacteriales bacterium]